MIQFAFSIVSCAPSKLLVESLLAENFSFSTQVKISFKENPVLCLCRSLLGSYLSFSRERDVANLNYSVEFIDDMFQMLGAPTEKNRIQNLVLKLIEEIPFFDFYNGNQKNLSLN